MVKLFDPNIAFTDPDTSNEPVIITFCDESTVSILVDPVTTVNSEPVILSSI